MDFLSLVKPDRDTLESKGRRIRALGIDLGTTNSTVAEVGWDAANPGPLRARCIEVDQPNGEGTYTHVLFPSVVAIHGGKTVVGEGAKRLRTRTPELELEPFKNLFFECKNDMGLKKTYHRAPEGFRSAPEIGALVMAALQRAALGEEPTAPDRVVVTVPASFQVAQRRDTIEAARMAGICIAPGDLLDEPVAAFIDYLASHPDEKLAGGKGPATLAVFDFGGGTCDVAIFRVGPAADGRLNVAPLAVSRYHRLGGGDIDAAIVHEVLIPELIAQNSLRKGDLGFEDKKRKLEPALLSLAESLKIAVCTEIARLEAFGKYDAAARAKLAASQPDVQCRLPGWDRPLALRRPTLSAARFDELLAPFLDTDLLYARDTEYRLTCSIFAPLQDALERAGLEAGGVDCLLMVGGSSLIPQVRHALGRFFKGARVLTWDDADSIQTAVARGAALHSLSLALYGRGLVQPVSHEAIALRTESSLLPLVPKGVELPWPDASGPARKEGLVLPIASVTEPVELRVELVGGAEAESRLLFRGSCSVPPPVAAGEPLFLEYRFDENQTLDLTVGLVNSPRVRFSFTLENPLTNVVNPQATRVKLDEIEEAIRTKAVPAEDVPAKLVEAAELMSELGHRERAFAQLKKVLKGLNRPDANIINKMALLAGEMGDAEREERLYREAADAAPGWGGSWFNLALSQKRRDKLTDALESVGKALQREQLPPYLVLRAMIEGSLGRSAERDASLSKALAGFAPVSQLGDWQLGWLMTAAGLAGDATRERAAKDEQQRRQQAGLAPDVASGVLPAMEQGRIMVM